MSNHPHKEPPTHTEEASKSYIIERHEDGSECRKCTNCACMNNKLAKVGVDNTKNIPTQVIQESVAESDSSQ